MILFTLKKTLHSILILWGVLTVIFFLFHVLPGDPARMMLDKREDSNQLELISKKYGFDKPLLQQYLFYLNDISPLSLHSKDVDAFNSLAKNRYSYFRLFDISNCIIILKTPYLRESFVRKDKLVVTIIKDTFKNTFVLAISAIIIALLLGLFFGVFSAIYKDSIIDKVILFFSAIGMSLPSFFSAILIAWFFGFVLHKYTGLPMTGSLYEIDDYGRGYNLEIKNLILPAITLGMRPLSVIVQLCRNSLLDVLSMDYVRTATAKGLNKFTVVFKHALRNSLNPVVTAISGWFASLLAGAVFVEYIFGWNGIGKEIVDALNKMDLPVIMGSVLFIASIFILINIIVDIIYAWIDPRVRI